MASGFVALASSAAIISSTFIVVLVMSVSKSIHQIQSYLRELMASSIISNLCHMAPRLFDWW